MTDIAYAAGVIDSDGSIGVRKRVSKRPVSYAAWLDVKQVTPEAIDLLHFLWGGTRWERKPQAATCRPLQAWTIHSRSAGVALEEVLPHLRIKRAQAQNAIELQRLIRENFPRFEPPPDIVEGEPLVSLTEAAERVGISPFTAYSAVRLKTVPFVRLPRKGRPKGSPTVMIPESFIEVWCARGARPKRSDTAVAAYEACFQRAKELNRVGVAVSR